MADTGSKGSEGAAPAVAPVKPKGEPVEQSTVAVGTAEVKPVGEVTDADGKPDFKIPMKWVAVGVDYGDTFREQGITFASPSMSRDLVAAGAKPTDNTLFCPFPKEFAESLDGYQLAKIASGRLPNLVIYDTGKAETADDSYRLAAANRAIWSEYQKKHPRGSGFIPSDERSWRANLSVKPQKDE